MKKRLITLNVILGIIVVLLMSSFLLINSFFKENIPVIAYQEEISIKEFTKQIEWLKDNKYQTTKYHTLLLNLLINCTILPKLRQQKSLKIIKTNH